MRETRARFLAGALILALPLSGCYSFALHQTAHRLAPGQTSITPGISRQAFIDGDEWDYHDGFSVVDVQVRHGLERYEIGGRISRINLQDGYQFVSFDPKISLVEDRLAFFSPLGVFFSDPFPSEVESIDVLESFQVHPSLIATIPLGKSEQYLNLGVRGIVGVDNPAEYLTGINLGLRLTPGEEIREAVYPEIGLFTTPDGHYYFYFGMALSFTFGGP